MGGFTDTRDLGSLSPFFNTGIVLTGGGGAGGTSGFLATGFSIGFGEGSSFFATGLFTTGFTAFLGAIFLGAGLAAGFFAAGFAAFLGAGFLAAGFFLIAIQLAFF
ncbi:MAG: hypothetical protein WDO19_11650 [Bacteroidota bacterium]